MEASSTDVVAAMICHRCDRVDMNWVVFLSGILVGCTVALAVLGLGIWSMYIPKSVDKSGEQYEPFRASFVSTADNTSISTNDANADLCGQRRWSMSFGGATTPECLSLPKRNSCNCNDDSGMYSQIDTHIASLEDANESVSPTILEFIPEQNSCCSGSDMLNKRTGRRYSGRASVTFRDGISANYDRDENYNPNIFQASLDIQPVGQAKIEVVSEESWFADDADIIQAREFDERVLSKITCLEESRMYLRRTRAVSMLSTRLMAASDERSCYEIVSRLLVPLFHVDRISYVLMKDANHMLVTQITVNKKEHMVMGLDKGFLGGGRWEDEGYIKPLKGTAVEECSKTLKPHYCPNAKDSPFETQRQIASMGVNTILATPILVNGNKFIGCIMICMVEVDAFREYDRILIQDIAKKLGVNIYAKRIKHAAEMSLKTSREMLHSMIPPYVIDRISCFWDERSEKYHGRSSSFSGSASTNPYSKLLRRNSSSQKNSDDVRPNSSTGEKVHILSKMYRQESKSEEIGTLVETHESNFPLSTTTKALYAENVNDVCIIFADIVGFSRISLELEPFVVVNMLQDLFARFDELCDLHNVQKLETIGDAYICTAGIDRGSSSNQESVKDSAVRILNMAKDMVRQARHVLVPTSPSLPDGSSSLLEKTPKRLDCLEIRVGIHVGNVTCGVLGLRLPKMTVFGTTVNISARMEQTCVPNHVRVTKDFYDLVAADTENQWDKCEDIEMKNMGTMTTYLLNPLQTLHL